MAIHCGDTYSMVYMWLSYPALDAYNTRLQYLKYIRQTGKKTWPFLSECNTINSSRFSGKCTQRGKSRTLIYSRCNINRILYFHDQIWQTMNRTCSLVVTYHVFTTFRHCIVFRISGQGRKKVKSAACEEGISFWLFTFSTRSFG